MPSSTASTPRVKVVMRETFSSEALSALPFFSTVAYRSWDTADAPDRVRPATTARMVAKATAEMKPKNTLPPTALASSTAAMLDAPAPPLIAPSWANSGLVRTMAMAPKPMMKIRM